MVDRAKKISELTVLTSATGDDLLVVVDDPSGNAVTKSITATNLLTNSSNVAANFVRAGSVPAAADSTGTAGEIVYNSTHLYICVAANTWKRVELSTW